MLHCCLFFVAICLEEGCAVPFGELVSRQGGDHDNDAAVCQRHNHCVTDTDAKWGLGTLTCPQNQLPLLQISAFQWNYSLFPIRIWTKDNFLHWLRSLFDGNMQVKEITDNPQLRAKNRIMRKSFRTCGRSVLSRLKNGLIAEGSSPHPALKWRCRRRRLIFPTNHSLERIRSPPGESGGNYRGKHLTWGTTSS